MVSCEEIIKKINDHQVKFIHLQFTDILGAIKSAAIPVSQIDNCLNYGTRFDGSAVEGFMRVQESDMVLKPDLETFAIFHWNRRETPTARLICDIYYPDGKPFEGSPRHVLKKVLEEFHTEGYDIRVGPEVEFFLFHYDDNGFPTTHTHDNGTYFDFLPIDKGEETRRKIVLFLQEMGFSIEAAHHENSPGQHEIDLCHSGALQAADNIVTLKTIVKKIAKEDNLHATFMPKPIADINGSGLHINLSLFRKNRNLFYSAKETNQLTETALFFIGGLLSHARGFTAITNPLVNSYKRFVPNFEAPIHIAWSFANRSPLIRIPAERGERTRIELRNPDPSCNPYLCLSVILKAGLDGIKQRILPSPAQNINFYELSQYNHENEQFPKLPLSLPEALDCLIRDDIIQEVLGEHILKYFVQAKQVEWQIFHRQVHPWEISQYLSKF
jgi:glutamine synthetase